MHDVTEQAAFEHILEYLRQTRGFDFTAYKRTSLMRRVLKRMHAVQVPSFDEYLDYLQVHPKEFAALFNTILINVTSFFRDADVWEVVSTSVLPEILANRQNDHPIRVWSAGCASGQEAFTAAMLIAEAVGLERFREHVKIYATDVDEEALIEARQAVYPVRQLSDVPKPLRDKYFDKNGETYTFNRELRRSVIFGRHDLIQDAPISRLDLLLCRNTLMYFNADAQSRIMARFYFSVNSGGFVVLGRAEMLFSQTTMFNAVDLKRRIFKTLPKVNNRDRLLLLAQSDREDVVGPLANHGRLRDMAFEAAAEPQIVLDALGVLVAANAAARHQFGLATADIGAPLQDLELSYRPADLRSSLDRALIDRSDVILKDVPLVRDGTSRFLDIVLSPLYDGDRLLLGTRISFIDVTSVKTLREELTDSKRELETAYEELQSTNEELETTNEELQSTVEELETTNEELQSTNEELETMNEELQSTNEELQTMNDELRNRSTELNTTNTFMEAVFRSLQSAVVVVDREMRVMVWNVGALNLWGLRPEEAQGQGFFGLDIGLPVNDLVQPIRELLNSGNGHREIVISAITRKGKPIQCRVRISPLLGHDRSVTGAILLMDEEPVN